MSASAETPVREEHVERVVAPIEPPHGLGIAELSLALGGFAIGTAEFAAMGILPEMPAICTYRFRKRAI